MSTSYDYSMGSPDKKLHPVMFAGTGSDVGKSVIAAAFCRIFRQDGYSPAPFKAQNMALNSYATPDGLEIGRAQAVQAEAAGVPCHTDMNPLLLKPCTDQMAQVVLNGKSIGNKKALELFAPGNDRDFLRREVFGAFDRLAGRYNPVVMEGAGSISEINLHDRDLVNMPMALHAGADVILVADIDRGGVFGSVYGSVMLLSEEERRHLKGILINKFRGDLRLFEDGVKMLEKLCGIPVVGVVPYYHDIHIEEEDSVMLHSKHIRAAEGKVNVAVVLLRHLSNFTDFNSLERDPRVHLFYTNNPGEIEKADIIILPGSKSTIADLYELRRNGVAGAVVQAARSGQTVMGICGGYQMMGLDITDPLHVESDQERMPGLGLLPVTTTLAGEKITRQVEFTWRAGTETCQGYEIHMGLTEPANTETIEPVATLSDGTPEGCYLNEHCLGTYLHGALDNQAVVDFLLKPYEERIRKNHAFDYRAFKEKQYDKLAEHVRKHVNLKLIYDILKA